MIFVYGLIDPRDQTIFYVGLTRRGAVEPGGYVRYAHRGSTTQKVRRYLRRLFKLGVKAEWTVLEECLETHLADAERFWIASLRAAGAILMNVKDGGEGGGIGQRHSAETRAKIGAKSRLKVISPEARQRISASNTGRRHTDEARRKMRKPKHAGHGAKVSAARKGVPRSPETTARMIAAGKFLGRPKKSVDVVRSCSWCGAILVYPSFDRRVKQKRVYCNVEHLMQHRKVPGWNNS